jgi:hypothetical protein
MRGPFRRWGWFVPALFLILAACNGVDFSPSSNTRYRPWMGVVQVANKLPDRYIPIGVVIAHGPWNATEESMLQQLKERAAGFGANVIVIQGGPAHSGNSFIVPEYELSAIAIRTVQ